MRRPDTAAAASGAMPAFGEFVAMMAALMALTALSIDIMLPALPQIEGALGGGGANDQQLVVTHYLIGFAAGQLVYGALSDRFGRRGVLLFGLGLYAVASFLCVIADTFDLLLAARFIQGAGSAAPRVIAVAVVRDLYGGRRMAEVMSFVMMVFIIVPVVAPTVGAAWLAVGSWRAIFASLFVLALALLAWMAFRLPETRPPSAREPLSAAWIGRAVMRIVATRQTLGYTLATGVVFGSLMGYINSAQQIFTEVYGLGAWFPVVFGCVALALAASSFANSRLVGRFGMRRMSHLALVGFVTTAGIHFAIAVQTGAPPLPVFLALLALCLFCFGFMMPNFNALAMQPMGRIAGTASSFVGAATTAVATGLGWHVGQLYAGSVLPLLAGYLGFGALGLAIVLLTERGRLFGTGRPDTG